MRFQNLNILTSNHIMYLLLTNKLNILLLSYSIKNLKVICICKVKILSGGYGPTTLTSIS